MPPAEQAQRRLIKKWMRELLLGLSHVHSEGIMHRDLKPGNLMLSHDGTLKIIDFGVAGVVTPPDHAVTVYQPEPQVGTLWYRAPEIDLGDHYGSAVDLFSAGLIMYELFKGQALMGEIRSPMEQEFIVCSMFDNLHTLGRFRFPGEDIWPGVSGLPNYHLLSAKCHSYFSVKFQQNRQINPLWARLPSMHHTPVHEKLREAEQLMGPRAFRLYRTLTQLDPKKRKTAARHLEEETWLHDSHEV
jgi:serine/threonine protein kinase